VLITRSYKSIPETERRGQDQVRHAGEDEDRPRHTPAAPGGVLEKFKSVPLVTGLDMACFGGAVLASSAAVFLLSKLNMGQDRLKQTFT